MVHSIPTDTQTNFIGRKIYQLNSENKLISPSRGQGHVMSQWNHETKKKNQSVRLHPAKSFQIPQETLLPTAFALSAASRMG